MISVVNLPEEKTEAAKHLLQNPSRHGRYLLLDMQKMQFTDRKIFESLMEIMSIRMQIESVNKYLNSTGAKNIIPSSILNYVVDHALRKEPLNDNLLEEYFNLQKNYKAHAEFLDRFSSKPGCYFDTVLDLALLGASFEDQWLTEHGYGFQEEFYLEVQDEIVTITESFVLGLVDYQTFIKRAKHLASLVTEEANRLRQKRNLEVYKIKEIKKPKK